MIFNIFELGRRPFASQTAAFQTRLRRNLAAFQMRLRRNQELPEEVWRRRKVRATMVEGSLTLKRVSKAIIFQQIRRERL